MAYLVQHSPQLSASRLTSYDAGQRQFTDPQFSNQYHYKFSQEWSRAEYTTNYGGYDTSSQEPIQSYETFRYAPTESVPSYETPPSTPPYYDVTPPWKDANPAPSNDANPPPPYYGAPVKPKRASRRGPDHIPRPRNAFMIFRSELCASGKISKKVEGDHRHISITAAAVWRAFTDDEKHPYVMQAEYEKVQHRRMYPNYRFTPTPRAKKPVKRKVNRNGTQDIERSREVAKLILSGKQGHDLEEAVLTLDQGGAPAPDLLPPPPSAPRSPIVCGWVPQSGAPETVDYVPDLISHYHFSSALPTGSPSMSNKVLMPLAPEQYAPNYALTLPRETPDLYSGKPRSPAIRLGYCEDPHLSQPVLVDLYKNVVDRPFR